MRDLGFRHLEREQRDRQLEADGEVRGDAEAERRLAHARARGNDDEVPRLEARRQPIEVAETRRHAGHVLARLVELGDALEAFAEEDLDVRELARNARLRQLEDDLLRAVHEIRRLAGAFPPEPGNLCSGANEPPERRHVGDNPRIVSGVRGRRHEGCKLVDADAPTRPFELPALL